jgi:hypothetical protein
MTLDPSQRDARERLDTLDAELDALVAREVDALALRRARPGLKRGGAEGDRTAEAANGRRAPAPEEAGTARGQRPEARTPKLRPQEGNVIGIRRAASAAAADGVLFSAEEEAFIEQSVAFLKRRENADLIIEEVWTHAVLDHDDGLGQTSPDDAPLPAGTDELDAEVLPGELPSVAASNEGRTNDNNKGEVASIQPRRGKDLSAAGAAGPPEALAPNSTAKVTPKPELGQRSTSRPMEGPDTHEGIE